MTRSVIQVALVLLMAVLIISSPSSAADPRCLTALLDLLTRERVYEAKWAFDRFGFDEAAFLRARRAISSRSIDSSALISLFEDLQKTGLEYEVQFSSISAAGKTQKFRGTVSWVNKPQGFEPGVYLDTKSGKSGEISLSSIDPKSIRLIEKRVPSWVFESKDLSQLAPEMGIPFLTHVVRYPEIAENAVFNILKSGKLERPSHMTTGSAQATYVSLGNRLTSAAAISSASPMMPVIELKTTLLNRSDYFINQYWEFGRYSNGSIRFDESDRLRRFLYQYGQGQPLVQQHEVVFHEAIPISEIKHIFLSRQMRARILNRLAAEVIAPPEGITWEGLLEATSP